MLAAGDLPGRDEARRLAQEELSKQGYADARPSLVQRGLDYVLGKLDELVGSAQAAVPGGLLGLALLALLIALLVVVVVVRVRPARSTTTRDGLFALAGATTAGDHRRAADAAAAQGKWDEAVRERLRAVVRELESRGLLDPRPSRTADEVARDVSDGSLSPRLRAAATCFDEVWYGGRTATAADDALLRAVDDQVCGVRA